MAQFSLKRKGGFPGRFYDLWRLCTIALDNPFRTRFDEVYAARTSAIWQRTKEDGDGDRRVHSGRRSRVALRVVQVARQGHGPAHAQRVDNASHAEAMSADAYLALAAMFLAVVRMHHPSRWP